MAIIKGRQQAHPKKPFALFLIGMRVNRFFAVHQWLPVAMAMPRMQAELAKRPEAGLLWQKNFLSGRIALTLQSAASPPRRGWAACAVHSSALRLHSRMGTHNGNVLA